MSGSIKGGHTTSVWVRWTACLRKLDGRWLVTHEQDAVLEPDASACAVSVKVSGPGCSLATSAAISLAGSSGHEPTGGWRQIDADEFNLDDPQTVEDGLAEGSTFDRTRHKVLIVGVSEYIEGPLQITVELPSPHRDPREHGCAEWIARRPQRRRGCVLGTCWVADYSSKVTRAGQCRRERRMDGA